MYSVMHEHVIVSVCVYLVIWCYLMSWDAFFFLACIFFL